jgi:hypothetical protein
LLSDPKDNGEGVCPARCAAAEGSKVGGVDSVEEARRPLPHRSTWCVCVCVCVYVCVCVCVCVCVAYVCVSMGRLRVCQYVRPCKTSTAGPVKLAQPAL